MATKSKNTPSKTLNPLHFEDLEPHRFEDLVRQLVYEFKEWQSIEATGRGGGDEGFDIRAWEKVQEETNRDEDDEENIGRHPMEGNLWMVQCKREKVIGPTRVVNIINDGVAEKNPPYGYILVAPVNFSKKSYDAFRETLRAKGMTEFYLWGKAELEDMLSLPKNDHVLFTFFGISLAVRRRSKSSEIKFQINNKNKLLRVLSDGEQTRNMNKSVLIRDIKDEKYPWKDKYKDFDKHPRWEEHVAFGYHPLGLLIHVHEYWAYIDIKKKVFDFTETDDLVYRQKDNEARDQKHYEKRGLIMDFWNHLPRKNQSKFLIEGLISFDDMLVIDDKGDILHNFPHIYVDFRSLNGPFRFFYHILEVGNEKIYPGDEKYKRVKMFPSVFPKIKNGQVYKDKSIQWDQETLRLFNSNSNLVNTLFDVDGKYAFLKVRDAIMVPGAETNKDKVFIKITYKYKTSLREYLEENGGGYIRDSIERQVGRKVGDNEKIDVFEFEITYEWALKT